MSVQHEECGCSGAEGLRVGGDGLEHEAAAPVHLQEVVVVPPQRLAVRYREQGNPHLPEKYPVKRTLTNIIKRNKEEEKL